MSFLRPDSPSARKVSREIRCQVNVSWLRGSHSELAKRLQEIVIGHAQGFTPEFRDGKWQLDSGNNWWMDIHGDEIEIRPRLPCAEEKLEALRDTINLRLSH